MGLTGKRAALTCFEIHQVIAQSPAIKAQACVIAFLQHIQVDAKTGVGRFSAGNRLKYQVQRHTARSIGQEAAEAEKRLAEEVKEKEKEIKEEEAENSTEEKEATEAKITVEGKVSIEKKVISAEGGKKTT